MPATPPRVTLKDVASLSGVSVPTVSRVLNGRGRVAPATRQLIQDTAERLGFQPNALAQQFASGRSNTVGLYTMNGAGAFTMPVLTGALRALGALDYAAQLYDTRASNKQLSHYSADFLARRLDGLLVIGDGTMHVLPSITSTLTVPVVYAFGLSVSPEDVVCYADGKMAGRTAIEHLAAAGCRNIAHITSNFDLTAELRAEGAADALAARGMSFAGGAPLLGDWSAKWGAEGASRLLAEGVTFDAVFCGNDEIATGVYQVLHDAGLRIPEDVSLIGVDNVGRGYGPRGELLTTIDPRLPELGSLAISLLMDALAGQQIGPGTHLQPCTLVPGRSVRRTGV